MNVKENLTQGIISPHTSPISSGFFVKKRDGGLRLCFDYQILNAIFHKCQEPVPLIPPALEQFREASVTTKLDLWSAYNLVTIQESDEWKTFFITTTGQYEHLVMPYGLVNIHPFSRILCFRCCFFIVHIDNNLIYSPSLDVHVGHVQRVGTMFSKEPPLCAG